MSWPRRRTLLVVMTGIVIAGALAAVLFVSSGGLHNWLRTVALSQITRALDADVSIGRLSGSLLRGVTVHDLRIVRNGRVIVAADAVEVGYQLLQIVRGNLIFGDLRLIRPRVWLEQTDTGWTINELIRDREPAASPRDWKISFNRLSIEDGVVDLLLLGRDPLRFEQLDLSGQLGLAAAGSSIRIDASTFHEVRADLAARVAGLISIDTTRMVFRDFTLAIPGADLSGQLVLAKGVVDEAKLNARLTNWYPGALAPYLSVIPTTLPPLTGDLTADGNARAIDAQWTLTTPKAGRSNGRVRLSPALPETIGIVGDLAVQDLNPAGYAEGSRLSGRINAQLKIGLTVALDDIRRSVGTVSVRARQSRIAQYAVDRLDGQVRIERAQFRVSGSASAYRATTTFAAAGRIGSGGGVSRVDARGRLANLNLASLPAALKVPAIASDLSADYVAMWAPTQWSVQLAARESTISGIRIADSTAIAADGHGSSLTLSGNADVAGIPAALLRLPKDAASELRGNVRLQATIPDMSQAADLSRLTASVEFSAVESDPQSLNPLQATGAVALEGGVAQISRFEIRSPLVTVSASGRVAVVHTGFDSELLYTVDASDISRLTIFGAPAMKGSVRTTGRITGPAGAWRVAGTFAGQELAYGDQFEALTVNGAMDVVVNSADWPGTAGTVSLESSFLTIAGTELLHATVLAGHRDRRLDVQGKLEQAQRSIEFDTGIDFHPDHQEVHLREMTIAGPGAPWTLEGTEDAVVRYGAAELAVDRLALVRGGERIAVSGRLPLDPYAATDTPLVVELTNVNTADLTQLALGAPRLAGTANGVIRLIDMKEGGTADADISLVSGTIANVPFSDITVKGSLAKRMAEIHGRVTEPRGVALDVAGTVPIASDAGEADLRVAGTGISLGLIEAATTTVTGVQGMATVNVHVTGPLSALNLQGDVAVGGGALTVVPTGVEYRDIVADVHFDNEWAVVNQASLVDGAGGTLSVSGRTGIRAVQGARAVELAIRTDGIRVLNNDLGDVTTSADLRVSGRLSAPTVEGRVVATSARLEVDRILLEIAGPQPLPPAVPDKPADVKVDVAAPPPGATAAVADPPPPEPPASTGWPGARMNVVVELPDNVVVRGRNIRTGAGSLGLGDLNLTLGGQVDVRKAPDQTPVVVGAVEVVRGFYDFQGRRFDVTRGSGFEFRGGESTNPALDVRGEREVSGVLTRVHITGTARQPVLALSSQPPLSESDILALIVFNQPLNQLGSNEQVDLLQRASDLALGAVASRLTNSIGRSLNVDLFEIRAPTSDRPGEVAVGTQLSQRVFVGFRQQFGTSDLSRLSIEYQISRALRLLTTVSQGETRATDGRVTDTAGMDLIYTIKY